jgi:hypothetical protein
VRFRGRPIFFVAKLLEGAGLLVILVACVWSMFLGFRDRGLESMGIELRGLAVGAGLFCAGWILERALGSR